MSLADKLRGALRRPIDAAWGFAAHALGPDEKSRLGVALYDRSREHRGLDGPPWEEAWLGASLPAPPARVLVGACGAGREAMWLVARGYAVLAFEPGPRMAALARERLEGRALVATFRYEDVTRDVPGVGATRTAERHEPTRDERRAAAPNAAILRGCRFDAVLLGWGSLSHVLDASERVGLLRALDTLCAGPILASWLRVPAEGLPAEGRARRAGAALGRIAGRLRNVPPPDATDVVYRDLGFAHAFTDAEIESLAAASGRRVAFGDVPDPGAGCGTFVRAP